MGTHLLEELAVCERFVLRVHVDWNSNFVATAFNDY